jgi:hypothetical protein
MMPLLANGVSRRELLMPLVAMQPGSETLGIAMPPAHMQNEKTSRWP